MTTLKKNVRDAIIASAKKNGLTVTFGKYTFTFYNSEGALVAQCANSVVTKKGKIADSSNDDTRLFSFFMG